ncbi:MAG: hypothetical protein M3Y87_00135 [Myxococcota bacterium]|nr:hypothetical protein [Myxococcota bacterium]
MRSGRSAIAALLLTGALGGIGYVAAQEAETAEELPAEGEITARRRADLTPAEQLAESQRIDERGALLSRRVAAMLDEARRENDVIRVTCLDDKLTQINAHRRTLAARVESLQDASNVGDEGRRNHEFTVITVLAQNLTELERAANECIGQDIFETGTTRVTTTIDPNTPDDDPSVIVEAEYPEVPFIPPPPSEPEGP